VLSPVQATLAGWLAVALWNFWDIALLPLSSNGLSLRARHFLVDFGHVLGVALLTAAAVALLGTIAARLRVRPSVVGFAVVAVAAGALGPIVLSDDLEGAYERLLPDNSDWLLWLGSSVLAQALTACFVVGRWCARPRLRWVTVAAGAALIAANAVVLQNGYPGVHVLLSASGATLIASSLSGARRSFRSGRRANVADATSVSQTVRSRVLRPASAAWALAAALSAWSFVLPPSSGLQVELLARDTPLLFPWLRRVYATPRAREVAVPPELRPSFERRAGRPDIAPSKERLLPAGPIVVVITIDALRFDVLEPRHRHAAPNLHEIREKAVYFAQARSSGSSTLYSMATLFTGLHQSMLRWTTKRGRRLSLEREQRPRFPELLQKAGVQTVGGLSVTMLQPRQAIARGFEERLRTGKDEPTERSRSDAITRRIIERLRAQGPEPLFLYTHFMDPHDPYETHGRPVKSKFDAYLVDVSVADESVGRIRRAIAELGLGQRTALIISADHGEGFGEHRIFTHGKSFYDVLVRVPLMVELPGVAPRTVDDFVALMDVGPTVLDLFGVPTPGHFMAETLTPYFVGKRGDPNRVILMEKPTERAMLFPDGLKVMDRRGAYELYDVRRDPDEKDDLWERLGDESQRRLALLHAYVRAHAGRGDVELH
jgi:hypothetical protein